MVIVLYVRKPLHSLSDVSHPGVALLLGGGVDLVHLGLIGGGADEEHGLLLVCYFPHDQLLQRDHRWLVVLNKQNDNPTTTPVTTSASENKQTNMQIQIFRPNWALCAAATN